MRETRRGWGTADTGLHWKVEVSPGFKRDGEDRTTSEVDAAPLSLFTASGLQACLLVLPASPETHRTELS